MLKLRPALELALKIGVLGLLLAAPASARENFLILVIDDVGVDGINVYSRDDLYGHPGESGSPGPTPNIDQLAAEGILFRNAYTNPKCSPTRAQTLTGRHGFRTGIGTPGGAELPLDEITIPEMLGSGWRNAALGKWHISGDVDHPYDSGFEYYAGHMANLGSNYFSYSKVVNGVTTDPWTVYATTDEVDEAIDIIADYGEQPWFVWVAFHTAHGGFHEPPSELHTYNLSGSPDNATLFRAMIEAADTEIGRLLASIPQSILDDTTIVLMGDNGSPRNTVLSPFISTRAKGTQYEGGVNVPLIVKSPHIDPLDRGKGVTALVNSTDLFATVAEIAGVAASAEDSLSIVPYLQNPDLPTEIWRSFVYAESFLPNGEGPYTSYEKMVRDDTYKLISRDDVYEEFFNLDDDPWEKNNLLPVSNLTTEEQIAYDALVLAIEDPSVVPEPGQAVLLAVGGVTLLALRRRRSV
jgi:arylsulfatase A-like enzyme